ncbi:hypothetical protein CHARACLAT_008299 [Characodon lateralis]|uniref:Uncharacterized protein n=1 Tax=Characodon lateralis TaxID=208331 RepID=A0ABU7E219_9TELE|nr:hypothetical protein [Characodon lateralis]
MSSNSNNSSIEEMESGQPESIGRIFPDGTDDGEIQSHTPCLYPESICGSPKGRCPDNLISSLKILAHGHGDVGEISDSFDAENTSNCSIIDSNWKTIVTPVRVMRDPEVSKY